MLIFHINYIYMFHMISQQRKDILRKNKLCCSCFFRASFFHGNFCVFYTLGSLFGVVSSFTGLMKLYTVFFLCGMKSFVLMLLLLKQSRLQDLPWCEKHRTCIHNTQTTRIFFMMAGLALLFWSLSLSCHNPCWNSLYFLRFYVPLIMLFYSVF